MLSRLPAVVHGVMLTSSRPQRCQTGRALDAPQPMLFLIGENRQKWTGIFITFPPGMPLSKQTSGLFSWSKGDIEVPDNALSFSVMKTFKSSTLLHAYSESFIHGACQMHPWVFRDNPNIENWSNTLDLPDFYSRKGFPNIFIIKIDSKIWASYYNS